MRAKRFSRLAFGVAISSAVLAVTIGRPTAAIQQSPPRLDLLIVNARIIDGTGGAATTGWVGIRDGRIAAIGQRGSGPAVRTIDARGKVLAPGFIDPHSHSDYALLVDGNAESKIRQGVTTEVIGESGSVRRKKSAICASARSPSSRVASPSGRGAGADARGSVAAAGSAGGAAAASRVSRPGATKRLATFSICCSRSRIWLVGGASVPARPSRICPSACHAEAASAILSHSWAK